MASTAMFALKPLTTFARAASEITGLSGSYGKLAFLHTANLNAHSDYKVIQYINEIWSGQGRC